MVFYVKFQNDIHTERFTYVLYVLILKGLGISNVSMLTVYFPKSS